ncbi:MAG TPA: DUF2334 domain-containing protein [Clostridia bacterium]|nr:DUF2334 domain-containing protein [Clostridia bacterium]
MTKYLYRMDDITPDMNWERFWKLINLFKKYKVRPLLGVVPDNRDPNLSIEQSNEGFWETIKSLREEGSVEVAMHGYQHVYETKDGGLLKGFGFKPQSEFAGLPYETQYNKIKDGKEILTGKGIHTDVFMAPGHTFDEITLTVLKELGFKYVTDGIALYPFHRKGLTFVPQQIARPKNLPCGIITVCLHSNNTHDGYVKQIERHLSSGAGFISFSQAIEEAPTIYKEVLNGLFRLFYILARKLTKLYR